MEFSLTENWLIDELSGAGQEHLDELYVSGYDRKAQFDPADDIQQLRQLGLSTESSVIDFGSGTGTFAMAVAPYCKSVMAVDPSPVMNALLQEAMVKAGITNLSIANAGFLSYRHLAEPVDFIFTRNALHHLPDFWKALALARLRSLLGPQGILRIKDIIFDFNPHQTQEKLEAWLSGAVADPSVGWTADELAQHVKGEYSTFSWLFELMLERTGFDIIERDYRRDVYGAYTCRVLSDKLPSR
jgi:SAM-dependent methyltransferase